ncbi:Protein unc-80-like protein, partial [Stegodyphus mimosarum]
MLDLLLSFGIIQSKEADKDQEQMLKSDDAQMSTPGTENSALSQVEKVKPTSEKKKELTLHHLFMDSLWRICKFLGCPHGCGEGHRCRPTTELLRMQILNAFNRLYEADRKQFRNFLQDVINS